MTEPTNQPAAELLPCPFSLLPERVHTALHIVWGKAVGTTDYDKSQWIELDDALHEMMESDAPHQPPAVPLDAREIDVVSQCRGNETGFHTCGLPIGGCGATALTTTPATSEAQTAQSDPTVTVSASGVDPSLPTHCDHGVSLDDPCETCRTAHPSPTTGAIEAATNEIMEHFHSIDIDALPNRKTITAIISKHLPPEAPSISAAIAEVQRWADKYEKRAYDLQAKMLLEPRAQFQEMLITDRDYAFMKRDAAKEIITALRALPPDARAVDAREVAQEIVSKSAETRYLTSKGVDVLCSEENLINAIAAAITATKKETK